MFLQAIFKKVLVLLFIITICGFLSAREVSEAGRPPMVPDKLEEGIYYTVHKGDTLWDISKRFYNNPWAWPYLWERNSFIHNPHWIYPGNRITIFKEIFRPVNDTSSPGDFEKSEETERYIIYPSIDSIGFIKEEAVRPLGKIIRAKEEKRLIVTGDVIYIRPLLKGAFKVGDRFTVFRTGKLVTHPETGKPLGVYHFILGVVRIEELRPKLVIGIIVKAFRAIHADDLLIPYKERSPKIVLTETVPSLKGEIILGEEEQTIFGDNQIVYIDIGKEDGVKVGQRYSVYKEEKGFIGPGKQVAEFPPVNLGEILVLATEAKTSGVLITKSQKTISVGLKVRPICRE
nr:LysM peptidoglycan-binding domain-containing protein [Desulfobacterales bacterium]